MKSLDSAHKVRCYYSNSTDQFQTACLLHEPGGLFERTVLPHTTLCFEADPQAILEIRTRAIMGAILSDRIGCDRLQNAPPQLHHLVHHQPQSV